MSRNLLSSRRFAAAVFSNAAPSAVCAAVSSGASIGATLDLSESRVSQMHSSILARLKAQMANRKKELQQATVV